MPLFNAYLKRSAALIVLAFFTGFSCLSAQDLPFCNNGAAGAQDCEDINCVYCNIFMVSGSSAGYGSDTDGDLIFAGFCGPDVSVQYFEFSAATSGLVFDVILSNCSVVTGVSIGIMDGCDQNVIACAAGNGTTSTSVAVGGLTVGNNYLLVIDIDATGPCDFVIHLNPINGTILPTTLIPDDLTLTGDFAVCPGAVTEYEIGPIDFNAHFFWSGPPGTEINGNPYPEVVETNEPNATVTWGSTGGQICVQPANPCVTGLNFCQNVTVTPIPTTVFPPPPKICAEDAPYILPWDEEAYSSGTYFATVPSYQGCDSMLMQTITFLQPIIKDLSPTVVCEGGCVTVCGEEYCGYGNYSRICQSVAGCDSTVNFSIVPPNLVANIQGSGTITCSNHSVTLTAAPSGGIKTWYNGAGQQVGMGSLYTVTSPGTYTLTAVLTVGGETCMVSDSIVIPSNFTAPPLTASGAIVNCDTLAVFIHSSSTANPAMYTWSGPNGFTSNLPNPQVTIPGAYVVTLVDLNNGCSTKDTVFATECCHTFAGGMDTASVSVCGEKSLPATFWGNQYLEPGDSLAFILYSNPADPLGSILIYAYAPVFPFAPGLLQHNTTYYAAVMAGPPLPNHLIDVSSPCFSLSPGQPVMWIAKPSIAVVAAPNTVCAGECIDVSFQLTGTPPFQFHYDILQNGQLLYSQDETSAGFQKTVTVCPGAFNQTPGPEDLQFRVNFLQDIKCGCSD